MDIDDRDILLGIGDTLVINNQVAGAHPIKISTSDVNTSPVAPEVTSETQSAYTFTPSTYGVWYYNCTVHNGMGGSGKLVDGVEQGFVEETEENLTTLAQMYLLASDYEAALAPALEVAEVSESGDGYDTYGYLHYVMRNYQEAADAFQMAIDKGNLSNRAETLLFLARALIELDDFEGAKDAATQSADAGGESERRSATDYITFIESTESRFNIIAERRQDAIDFYEPYPSLID